MGGDEVLCSSWDLCGPRDGREKGIGRPLAVAQVGFGADDGGICRSHGRVVVFTTGD